jgi:hypothetical protein
MKVGQLPVRSWLNFRDPATNPPIGMPIKNEYDLKIPFNAVSGTPEMKRQEPAPAVTADRVCSSARDRPRRLQAPRRLRPQRP